MVQTGLFELTGFNIRNIGVRLFHLKQSDYLSPC